MSLQYTITKITGRSDILLTYKAPRISVLLLLIFTYFISFNDLKAQDKEFISNYPPVVYRAHPEVYNITFDHLGMLYFGTNSGVTIFDGARWETIPLSNFSEAKTLELGPDSLVYVGGIGDFGYMSHDIHEGIHYVSLSDSLLDNTIRFSDIWQIVFHEETVYFQSYAGFFIWDKKNLEFEKIEESYLYEIDGSLYISNYLTGELYTYTNGEMWPVPTFPNIKEDLIYQVFNYDDSLKILATAESGFFLFNPSSKNVRPFLTDLDKQFKTNGFYDGLRLDANNYALGTDMGGIFFMDHNGKIINVFDKKSGLFADFVYDMKLDRQNDLWLATSYGLSRIKLDSLGIKLTENIRSTTAPKIQSINFKINEGGTWLYPEKNATEYQNNSYIIKGASLELMVEPSTLAFYFANPGFTGDEILYSTFLEGYDNDWSDWRAEPVREYTNLIGGDYVLNIKAQDKNTGELSTVQSFRIKIRTPWFKTVWFITFIIFSTLLITYLIIRLWIIRLRTKNFRLKQVVDKRTRDLVMQKRMLSEANESLTATNKELDSFIYHTSHDLKSPLKSILGLIQLARMDDTENKFTEYLNRAEHSIVKLEEFIASIIQYSTNTKLAVEPKEVNFNSILNNAESDLQFHDNFDKIRFEKNINTNGAFVSDPKRIQIIINNLLSNAIKYCDLDKDSPRILIDINHENDKIKIVVEDNGLGVNEEYRKNIFKMFFRASENSYGSGLGLYIIQETVKKLGGSIEMKSVEGEFTRFIILLPNQG